MCSVWFACEAVEHGFRAGGGDREDGSVAVCAAVRRRTVERAVGVEEAIFRADAVWFTCEAVEHRFRAGKCDLEHGAAVAGRNSAPDGGAVERARDVDDACPRVFTVCRADFEAVQHRFAAGRRDREDRAAEATSMTGAAPVFGGAVERALDPNERTRVRVPAVVPGFETVEHAVRGTHVRSFHRNSRQAMGSAACFRRRTPLPSRLESLQQRFSCSVSLLGVDRFVRRRLVQEVRQRILRAYRRE